MKKINKVTEEDIDVIGSSKLTATRIKTIISIVLMVAVFVIGFNLRINTANDIELNEIESSVTTTGNMTTTASTTSSITTTTTMNTTSSTTSEVTTVVTTTEETTTEEECIITMPVNIQVYVEPAYEEPTVVEEPVIEETIIEDEITEDDSSNEESTDPPVEDPVVEEETEPDFENMTYLGNLRITGYVATGNPTATGVYPYVGGIAMNRAYGIPYGTTIYIDGLGYFELFDTGCAYGVVDVFRNTEPECYALIPYADVYIVN